MRHLFFSLAVMTACVLNTGAAVAQDVPEDIRYSKYRNIYDKLHPWSPPGTLDEWNDARRALRQRLLVSNGLWPMPPRTSLDPRFGKTISRDGYSVQHVMFRSLPGHYVTGVLYRPAESQGRMPAVLCPHGHWANGRFYDSGNNAKGQLENGAESIAEAARYPLQARFVQLARMGCVVLHYDMVGYADSTAVPHRTGFNDASALLWLTNKMGLQTWNSIRALDFVCNQPDVDPDRIGVTGASGGGTQTFMLAALDPRPAAAFPAVMVSTNMQGGCVCENASYMRVGINNIAIAALFAPRPQAMSGADDWTIDIERLGLPELKQVYSLYGRSHLVTAKAWPQYKHNYNSHARQMMYHWFNQHLHLGHTEPITERGFKPLTRDEMTVYSSIEKPSDLSDAAELRVTLRNTASNQFASLFEGEADEVVARYQQVVGGAARVMFDTSGSAPVRSIAGDSAGPGTFRHSTLVRSAKPGPQTVRVATIGPTDGDVVVWVDGSGHEALLGDEDFVAAGKAVVSEGRTLATLSYLGQGSHADKLAGRGELAGNDAGLTYCYNLPLLSERVRDVATVLETLAEKHTSLTLVGTGSAGPIVLLAAATTDIELRRVIVDLNGFSFGRVQESGDPMMLPGALRYGDIGGLAAQAMPCELLLFGTQDVPPTALQPLKDMAALTQGQLTISSGSLDKAAARELITR